MSVGPAFQATGFGASEDRFGRLLSVDEARRLEQLPEVTPGETRDFQGRAMPDQRYTLGRSPGCFSVRIVEGGEAVIIGEDWIGPGPTTDEGGMQGCDADTPGLMFRGDGTVFIAGGATRVTAAEMYADTGDTGDVLLLALFRPYASQGAVVYKSILVPSGWSSNSGHWDSLFNYLDISYWSYHIIPIAMLDLASGPLVEDVYWSLESPAMGIPPVDAHQWRLWVYDDGVDEYFQVTGGSVHDGAEVNVVTGISETVRPDPLYIYLRVKYYNDPTVDSEFEIEYDAVEFPSSSCSYDVVPDMLDPTTLPKAGWVEIIIPLARWDSTNGILQWIKDLLIIPYGRTYTISRVLNFQWSGTTFQAIMGTEYYVRGLFYTMTTSLKNLFDTGPCGTPAV